MAVLPAPATLPARALRESRTAVGWALGHKVPSVALARAARRGDVQGRLVTDPSVRADPYPVYEEVRAAGPLVRARFAWMTASHATCQEVLTSPDVSAGVGLSGSGAADRALRWSLQSDALGPLDRPSLLVTEPPDHTRYRRRVSRFFTPRRVEARREQVEALAHRLLDAVEAAAADGPVDLVATYCEALPLTVIADLLGVPEADRPDVLRWGRAAAPSLEVGLGLREHRAVLSGLREYNAWLRQHTGRLRDRPGDDVLSAAVGGDDPLDDVEVGSLAGLLLAAGFETTVNLLGSATVLLHDHPEQRERLLDDAGGGGDGTGTATDGSGGSGATWANAAEEALRLAPPVQVTARAVVRDTQVAGQPLRRGDVVVTQLAGANRDPAVFEEPWTFDVGRPNARDHLAFGGGHHYCLGAGLARLEGEVGLRVLHERFPRLRLADGARRRPSRVLRGWARLPVHLR